MSEPYKLVEWQSESGLWHCEHTSSFPRNVVKWVLPARLLGLEPADFLKYLITEFQPDVIHHNEDYSFVGWAWRSQAKMRKFKNYIKREYLVLENTTNQEFEDFCKNDYTSV